MTERRIKKQISGALDDFKIIYIAGARRVGKTTLIRQLQDQMDLTYISFDDPMVREKVKQAPDFFLNTSDYPLAIDEVQKLPEIVDYIKMKVDTDQNYGLFVLTGSGNLFHNPLVYESLSGRIAIFTLYPLSSSEIAGYKKNFVETLFDEDFYEGLKERSLTDLNTFKNKLIAGQFPELALGKVKNRSLWFKSYLGTRLNKDLRDLTVKGLHRLDVMPKLLKSLAGSAGSLINLSNIAKDFKLNYKTVKSYLGYLEALFMIEFLQPYYQNISKQVTKTPKVYLIDTGLMAYLLGLTTQNLDLFSSWFGHLLENYIYLELRKEISYSSHEFGLHYFRDAYKNEVDFVIENFSGELIGIEVKTKTVIKNSDLAGLRSFYNKYGNRVKNMFVFYGGEDFSALKLQDKLVYLVPWRIM